MEQTLKDEVRVLREEVRRERELAREEVSLLEAKDREREQEREAERERVRAMERAIEQPLEYQLGRTRAGENRSGGKDGGEDGEARSEERENAGMFVEEEVLRLRNECLASRAKQVSLPPALYSSLPLPWPLPKIIRTARQRPHRHIRFPSFLSRRSER